MKKLFTMNKNNKGFSLVYTIILSFFIMSLLILIQIILNSRIENFKQDKQYLNEQNKIKFLNSILKQELKLIEKNSIKYNIDDISIFFDSNIQKNKIFLSNNKEFSILGYSLISKNINPKEYVQTKINNSFKSNIDLHFEKIVYVANKSYSIKVSIKYEIKKQKSIYNLSNGTIKTIGIKEND